MSSSSNPPPEKAYRIKIVEWTGGKHIGYVWAFIPQCYSNVKNTEQALTISVPTNDGYLQLKLHNAMKMDGQTKDSFMVVSVYKDMKTWKAFALDGCEEDGKNAMTLSNLKKGTFTLKAWKIVTNNTTNEQELEGYWDEPGKGRMPLAFHTSPGDAAFLQMMSMETESGIVVKPSGYLNAVPAKLLGLKQMEGIAKSRVRLILEAIPDGELGKVSITCVD